MTTVLHLVGYVWRWDFLWFFKPRGSWIAKEPLHGWEEGLNSGRECGIFNYWTIFMGSLIWPLWIILYDPLFYFIGLECDPLFEGYLGVCVHVHMCECVTHNPYIICWRFGLGCMTHGLLFAQYGFFCVPYQFFDEAKVFLSSFFILFYFKLRMYLRTDERLRWPWNRSHAIPLGLVMP